MFFPEPKLYPNFISEEERIILKNHALYLLDTKVLQPNIYGPNRFAQRFYSLDDLSEFHRIIYNRVVAILKLQNPIIDPYFGIVISVIKPGGFIHRHVDVYAEHAHHMPQLKSFLDYKNFRFNIMMQRENHSSYSPNIAGKIYDVKECDAWFFDASSNWHSTSPIKGDKYRIVYQFGFAIK